ncbi:unnamed protein product [Microthlaspi erraticum]|uniref:Uncharacterized protein n=1 Tax=Microthlaspi erraticum TaxID=1685480 RepID=A0A6D2J914_9BRAS|nr:unnamed protein product [Microthlaspi erraticum]
MLAIAIASIFNSHALVQQLLIFGATSSLTRLELSLGKVVSCLCLVMMDGVVNSLGVVVEHKSDLCKSHTLKTDHGIDLSSRTRSAQGQSPLLVWLEGVLLCRCGLARRLQVGCFKVGKKFLLVFKGDSLGGLSQEGGGA